MKTLSINIDVESPCFSDTTRIMDSVKAALSSVISSDLVPMAPCVLNIRVTDLSNGASTCTLSHTVSVTYCEATRPPCRLEETPQHTRPWWLRCVPKETDQC